MFIFLILLIIFANSKTTLFTSLFVVPRPMENRTEPSVAGASRFERELG